MAQYESVYRGATVAATDVNTRAQFLSRTYAHLTGAIFAFTLLEIALFKAGLAEKISFSLNSVSWLLVLGGFMVIGWLATRTAASAATKGAQYLALAGYVVAEAIIFVPLLYVADRFAPGVIASAAVVTFVGFAGLTAVVFVTRRDFSFLRGVLFWGFIVALVLIIASVLFGWNLGTWFSVGMIALAGAAILYDTSNVLLHYPEDRYISAALQLFASVALMFWYVLRLFLRLRD